MECHRWVLITAQMVSWIDFVVVCYSLDGVGIWSQILKPEDVAFNEVTMATRN